MNAKTEMKQILCVQLVCLFFMLSVKNGAGLTINFSKEKKTIPMEKCERFKIDIIAEQNEHFEAHTKYQITFKRK